MSTNNIHDEWLSLVEISGPFLAPLVLKEAFPQGLDLLDPGKRKRLRQTYEEWREALDSEDQESSKLHSAWIKEVISNFLGFDEDGKGAHLKHGSSMPSSLTVHIPEQDVTLVPEYVLVDEQYENKPLLLIQSYVNGIDLQAAMSVDGWSASPADRMVQLCRLAGCRLGLVTDGERWMLIDAPVGAVTTFASWYARIWIQEPVTLQAFVHLLGIRRFFVAVDEQIPALIDKSLQHQDEVTAVLGEQVQRAIEVLIQSLDRADQDRNRELLQDVTPSELYEAGLTVMMRLVFLLSAEERGLLLMEDECYEENYAISTLRMQLRSESEEILERRWDAWSRLLSVFRAVYGGIDHENMRLPALGGSLFDPDRFPFLEGRAKESDWHKEPAKPLPIDNRTVLLLLEAIQQYQGRSLSYRALDVEQIGYVYEGLLERTVKRTSEVILDIGATRSAEKPLVSLVELQSLSQSDESVLLDCLVERSGSSITRIRNTLARAVDDQLSDRLLAACLGNIDLRNRIKPYANLLRIDPWGYPLVYPAGSFVVTSGSDRRETGSHYTPKSLTETIVSETLTPVVYVGPAEGLDRYEWKLRTPEEILQLKICDPAMGSGAFLVQVCRFLSGRLMEAWRFSENAGGAISLNGDVVEPGESCELIPVDLESRNLIARRLIAERCLYGVDLNPLAVELAKLSIWLITMSKDRPFGFLDHNLRHGDSLLGLQNLEQLVDLSMKPLEGSQQKLFGKNIRSAVNEAIELRKNLRLQPIRNIHDIELMERLDLESREKLTLPNIIANAFIGSTYKAAGNNAAIESATADINIIAAKAIEGDYIQSARLVEMAKNGLSADLPPGKEVRRPFHWPLEFPEVFNSERAGFNAIVGNPPFLGGKKISTVTGSSYRTFIVNDIAQSSVGAADLSVYFLLRVASLIAQDGVFGLISTNSICEGVNKAVGLARLHLYGIEIIRAVKSCAWPGKAGVNVSLLWCRKGIWAGEHNLNGHAVDFISESLEANQTTFGEPLRLERNKGLAFAGTNVGGEGFILAPELALELLNREVGGRKINSDVIFPFLSGRDITSSPTQAAERFVINFHTWDKNKAMQYKECFDILTAKVKPYRDTITKQIHEHDYWKFWDKREESYAKIQLLPKVLVAPRVSKLIIWTWVKCNQVFSDQVVVLTEADPELLALFQSSIHQEWAWANCTTIRDAGIRYAPSNAIDNFPFPNSMSMLKDISVIYDNARQKYLVDNNVGLTYLYKQINNQECLEPEINNIRELHMQIDNLVCAAYGWDDIKIAHEFVDSKQGVRFTISRDIREEILNRLRSLNLKISNTDIGGTLTENKVTTKLKRTNKLDLPITQEGFDF